MSEKQTSGYGQIFIADFDGGNLKQITNNGAVNLSPTWAKDGSKITYTSYKSGKPEIYNFDLVTKKRVNWLVIFKIVLVLLGHLTEILLHFLQVLQMVQPIFLL